MQTIITELYYLWNEQGEMPYRAALERRLDRLHRLSEQYADSEQLWDACMEYACLLEQQAFQMGFVWSAGLCGELARFCPSMAAIYEKSPASSA